MAASTLEPAGAGQGRAGRGGLAGLPVALRHSHRKQDACDAKLADTPEELKAISTPLVATGVDVFQASTVATGFRYSTGPWR